MPPSTRKTGRKSASVLEDTPISKRKAIAGPGRPPKKNKSTSNKFFFFKMKGNMKDAFIKGEIAASMHRKEFDQYILQEKTFSKKGEFETFKKQHEDPVLNPRIVTNQIRENSSAKVDKLVSMMSTEENVDAFRGYWLTTSTAMVCVIVIRVTNQYGSEAWVWNPKLYSEIFRHYAKVVDVPDAQLHEAFSNMSIGKASDPDSADKSKPLVTPFSPKDDPSKIINLDLYRSFTYVTIPVDSFSSKAEEDNWCESTTNKIMTGIRDTINQDFFRATLLKIGESRRQNYIQKLFDPSKKTNLPKFLAGAVIKAKPAESLTTHVIEAVSAEIMSKLWENSRENPKYQIQTNDEEEAESDTENDNHIDTGDNEEMDNSNNEESQGAKDDSNGQGDPDNNCDNEDK